ncbi:hypothetical protein QN277_020516 [Acacia crassicarpa]|uniref:Uncharacterized protein n=1 Tax=Acacia crassicarpa TaxID=499986 RepID=A0AAE1JJW0_9FABA|nr:hypothetical protein QN277_020516 [Acacia crassicarpa]
MTLLIESIILPTTCLAKAWVDRRGFSKVGRKLLVPLEEVVLCLVICTSAFVGDWSSSLQMVFFFGTRRLICDSSSSSSNKSGSNPLLWQGHQNLRESKSHVAWPVRILSPAITIAFTKPLFALNPENSLWSFHTRMFLLSDPVHNKSLHAASEYM